MCSRHARSLPFERIAPWWNSGARTLPYAPRQEQIGVRSLQTGQPPCRFSSCTPSPTGRVQARKPVPTPPSKERPMKLITQEQERLLQSKWRKSIRRRCGDFTIERLEGLLCVRKLPLQPVEIGDFQHAPTEPPRQGEHSLSARASRSPATKRYPRAMSPAAISSSTWRPMAHNGDSLRYDNSAMPAPCSPTHRWQASGWPRLPARGAG